MSFSKTPLGRAITKHPFLLLGLFCLLLAGVFTQDPACELLTTAPLAVGLVTLVATAWVFPHVKLMATIVGGGVFTLLFLFFITLMNLPFSLSLGITGLSALLVITVCLWLAKQLTAKRGVLLLFAAGFLLRLCYVLYTTVVTRQHDVWYFTNGDFYGFYHQRHAEYIEYIATYLNLPVTDPTAVGLSQLYHPPFHHLLAGLWLRLNTLLGFSYPAACENIQLLTLFYSCAIMVLGYKILRFLGCKGFSLFLPLAILTFHPTFILMAGSVNNDLLSITLAIYALYATLRWAKEPTVKHIVLIALGVGFSMMSKLSGGLVAPAIALVFVWKWWESAQKKNGSFFPLFRQFALFGIICIPLALWWQTRNLILFDLPLTYVPALSENSGQYLGDYTVAQRLLGVPKESLREIFVVWRDQGIQAEYNEFNCLLALLKSSMFGEFTLFDSASPLALHKAGIVASKILFYANFALIACSLGCGIYLFTKKEQRHSPAFWLFALVWGVLLVSYIRFCFSYPQTCTQNFRYAVPTLMAGCAWLGLGLKYTKNRIFCGVLTACTLVFCLGSATCYTLLGLV